MKPIQQIRQFPRTLCVIYLQALDLLQGRFEVMDLLTGKIISCRKVTPNPITQEVIDRVEDLAKKDGIKYLLNFKYRKEVTIREDDEKNDDVNDSIAGGDDDYDDEYEPTKEDHIRHYEYI